MNQSLYNKYRPQSFDEYESDNYIKYTVIHQFKNRDHHALLLSGAAGAGKTTFARLLAKSLECSNVVELDAAQFSGVDTIRDLVEQVSMPGLVQRKICVIIDECQGLSGKASDALLKTVEEPPDHLIWIFNTTEPTKVSWTLKSRCMRLELKPLQEHNIRRILLRVAHQEGIELTDTVIEKIVYFARGIPREALTALGIWKDTDSEEKLDHILSLSNDDADIRNVVNIILRSRKVKNWGLILGILDRNKDIPAERLRIQLVNYITRLIFQSRTNPVKTQRLLEILRSFSVPYYDAGGMGSLLLSIADQLDME